MLSLPHFACSVALTPSVSTLLHVLVLGLGSALRVFDSRAALSEPFLQVLPQASGARAQALDGEPTGAGVRLPSPPTSKPVHRGWVQDPDVTPQSRRTPLDAHALDSLRPRIAMLNPRSTRCNPHRALLEDTPLNLIVTSLGFNVIPCQGSLLPLRTNESS
jgi:hypothetical protein